MRFSIEAEQSVLGSLIVDPIKFDEVYEIATPEDFYNPENMAIYKAIEVMCRLGKTVDVITLAETMESSGQLEFVGGLGHLVEIAQNTPSSANVKAYAHIVAERAMDRRIIDAGQRIAELGADDSIPVDDKLETLHSEISGLERRDSAEITPFDTILKSRIQVLDGKFNGTVQRGMMTGFDSLDERYQGISKSALWVLAARPGQGKTALAVNIARNIAATGKDVIIFSLEMGKEELADRLLSSECEIDSRLIRSGQFTEAEWPKLTAGTLKLKGLKIHIIDIPAIDIHRAKAIARKFKRYSEVGLIVVDYLQLMTDSKAKNRFEEVSSVSRELKVMAKQIGCPVLALSQLNRKVEDRSEKRPHMADLRESGQIEQDADIITFIYRDEYYHPDTPNKGVAEIITAKFREGEVGTDLLATQMQYAKFKNLDLNNYNFNWQPQKTGRRGFDE